MTNLLLDSTNGVLEIKETIFLIDSKLENEQETISLIERKKVLSKELKTLIESERLDKVMLLIDTIIELRPEESESIVSELLGIAKPKDFSDSCIVKKGEFKNYINYNGSEMVILMESGKTKVISLDHKRWVNDFKMDFGLYFKDSEVLYRESVLNEYESASIRFKRCLDDILLKRSERIKSIDTALTNINECKLNIKANMLAKSRINKALKSKK